MPRFFPRHAHEWTLDEPAVFRRLTLSLVAMAVLTGVVLRLFRLVVLARGSASLYFLGGMYATATVFLLGMATAHIGNYPVRQWLWRVPAFVGVEVAATMATSLALIELGRERRGTVAAGLSDWPAMAVDVLLRHFLTVALFALLLAGVVQLVRHLLLRHDHRMHTAVAIHEEHLRQTAEHDAHP